MLPEEQAANSRYFYELASAKFGYDEEPVATRAGLPLQGRPGREDRHRRPPARQRRTSARSPRCAASLRASPRSRRPPLPTCTTPADFARFADRVRESDRRHPHRLQAERQPHRAGHRFRARGRRRLHHSRRPRRRHRRRAAAVPGPHQRAHHSGPGPGAAPPRHAAASAAGHADHHRWLARAQRLRQGTGAGRGRHRLGEQRHAGHRLRRRAHLQHQQLPGRHRHAETGTARTPRHRAISRRS